MIKKIRKKKNNLGLTTPTAIMIVGLAISAALFFGLRASNRGQKDVLPAKNEAGSKPTSPKEKEEIQVSIDDDPTLGDKETAKVAIVEFSDYECPYCKRFWSQTLDKIKENFVDTGKAIFVYRDLPLSFHDPAATREANAAECVRKQSSDEVYFKFHDAIFEKTPGNGEGISEKELVKIGKDLGLEGGKLEECIQNQEFSDEIEKDAADARKAGITGTPGFVIGRFDQDGNVTGLAVKGAQPYVNFENIINQTLSR